jgi:hypothetical protein
MWNAMNSRELEQEGHFYSALANSALANFLFENPGKSDLIGKHSIKEIAASWKLGMPITMGMIEEPSPLPNNGGLNLGKVDSQGGGSDTGTPKGTPKKWRGEQPSLMAAKVQRDEAKKMY